jgi:hypothetical protein
LFALPHPELLKSPHIPSFGRFKHSRIFVKSLARKHKRWDDTALTLARINLPTLNDVPAHSQPVWLCGACAAKAEDKVDK